jgi:hypothetical protein
MGIKINGVLISRDRDVKKTECPHCTRMVADINLQTHINDCEYNSNKKKN